MTPTFDGSLYAPQPSAPLQETRAREYPSRELSKGETLYYAGDEAEAVYQVEEGLLKLSIDLMSGRERIIDIAGPGDFIGAITPSHLRYQDSAEVLSPRVRLHAMPPHELGEDLKAALFAAAGGHLHRLREVLEDSDLPVMHRLARTFVRLGDRYGQRFEDGTVRLTLPLTHDNLAAMVGAARETTTAVLSEMREQDLIQGTRGRYSFMRTPLHELASAAPLL